MLALCHSLQQQLGPLPSYSSLHGHWSKYRIPTCHSELWLQSEVALSNNKHSLSPTTTVLIPYSTFLHQPPSPPAWWSKSSRLELNQKLSRVRQSYLREVLLQHNQQDTVQGGHTAQPIKFVYVLLSRDWQVLIFQRGSGIEHAGHQPLVYQTSGLLHPPQQKQTSPRPTNTRVYCSSSSLPWLRTDPALS